MNKERSMKNITSLIAASLVVASANTYAACSDVSEAAFQWSANEAAVRTDQYGFGLPMWMTMVDETGVVCYVFSTDSATPNEGAASGNSAWLGSRVISAQKANTANAFSLDGLALTSGAIWAPVQPGGSLYGLQHSNPVDATVAYDIGDTSTLGTGASDPLVGSRVGGVNVFGGAVALYNAEGVKVGAIGASGDTSCRDQTFAYYARKMLGLDNTPNDDTLVLTENPDELFEHPLCGVNDPDDADVGVVQG
jgi:uncharacterized protein GlcG (DUF336 family)